MFYCLIDIKERNIKYFINEVTEFEMQKTKLKRIEKRNSSFYTFWNV